MKGVKNEFAEEDEKSNKVLCDRKKRAKSMEGGGEQAFAGNEHGKVLEL